MIMRLVRRNLRTVYYKLYQGFSPLLDEDGYETGEPEIEYGEPVEMKANISPASGSAQREQFGNLEDYDKVMITDDMNCPINENSLLYVDETDLEAEADYVVRRVAKSLNHISYAISKVKVS